jgi:hypothetical protein
MSFALSTSGDDTTSVPQIVLSSLLVLRVLL